MTGASNIAAGYNHSLAVKNGQVWAWGNNSYGQTNVPVAAQSGVTNVAGGGTFSLALKSSGTVLAWGAGIVSTNVPSSTTNGVTQIAAGEWHALALKNGGIIAWGSNSYGQCTVPSSLTSGVTAISGGGYYTMALKDGGVQIFGIEATNTLSYGIRSVPDAATSGVSAISAGRWHALALKDGGVLAWGSPFNDATNVPAEATNGVAAIAAGDDFSMALKTNGTLVIWGDVSKGQLPIPKYATNGITKIAAGVGHCLVISPVMPPRFTGGNIPTAYSNQVYSGYVTATADPAARYYPFGSWPSWLTLNETSGALGGTPHVVNMYFFSIVASNAYGQVTNSYTVSVFEAPEQVPVFVTTNPLPDGIVGEVYSKQIVVSNRAVFSVVEGEGSGLPPGLTLSTNGLLSGTPSATYNSFFMVRATNTAGASNKIYNIQINQPADPPVFVTESPLPGGVVGQPYSVQIVASNGPVFSVLAGSLPAGLGLTASGMVTGTPTQIENPTFTVQATNIMGASNRVYTLEIEGPPVFNTTSPLPGGSVGVPYTLQIDALGDPTFTVVGGSLPGGLSLSAGGLLNGTPDAQGSFNFTVRATNAYGWSNRVFDLEISQIPVFTTPSPLPGGMVGTAYSQQIVASGSPTFSVVAGSLPGGLDLSGAGLLSGTPTTSGAFNFTVRATNAYGWSNRVYDVAIGQVPTFTATSPLPDGQLGEAYSQSISALGNPTFSVVAGGLPGGLDLSGAGLLSGTPTNAGPFNFTVQATNAYGWSNRVFDLMILQDPSFTLIRYTNGNVRVSWTNPNVGRNVEVWRTTSLTNVPVVWSNFGVQVSPWTNTTPPVPSYYQLRMVP